MKRRKTNIHTGWQPLFNNGFTLIELLAVIVILAIIALIAVPQILNIINDSKIKSEKISVENYLRAVDISIINKNINSETRVLDGWYSIKTEGKVLEHQEKQNEIINIKFDGNLLIIGDIEIKNNKVISTSITTDNLIVLKNNGGDLNFYNTNKIEKSTLITGQKFNVALKNLVNKRTDMNYDTEDNSIISIEFYSKGLLPNGHTKESLKLLPQVSVSEKNDVIAYNDNGKVYIVSNNMIEFNQYSSDMFKRFKKINTKNVTSMTRMFYKCNSLVTIDVYNFDTSSVTSMDNTFAGCSNLTTLDVEKWDTAKVTEMQNLFSGCSNLTKLDVSSWNTSSATSFSNIFSSCEKLQNIDVSRWDTSKVTRMSSMFSGCSGLNKLDVSKWDTSSVTSMSSMFQGCSGLTNLNVSDFNTSKVTSMFQMFRECSKLESLDLGNWDTSNVINMQKMFYKCSGLTRLDVSGWDTSSVGKDGEGNMEGMFYGCSSIEKLDVSNWNTSNVTSMYQIFRGCSKLTNLNLSNWNTSNVTNMDQMFWGCKLLKPIFIGKNFKVLEASIDVFTVCATENEEQLCEPNSIEEWCIVNN